mmetsp:Transcript_18835/g.71303  ORF Transcript_18835/g.71303 Transcript_18835/m.71303 type:complete len:239 (+) Transcript_18835:582-1298(+)
MGRNCQVSARENGKRHQEPLPLQPAAVPAPGEAQVRAAGGPARHVCETGDEHPRLWGACSRDAAGTAGARGGDAEEGRQQEEQQGGRERRGGDRRRRLRSERKGAARRGWKRRDRRRPESHGGLGDGRPQRLTTSGELRPGHGRCAAGPLDEHTGPPGERSSSSIRYHFKHKGRTAESAARKCRGLARGAAPGGRGRKPGGSGQASWHELTVQYSEHRSSRLRVLAAPGHGAARSDQD